MLKSRLPKIPAELEARLREQTRSAADHVVEAARGRVPVVTGALRDAIHVERDDRGIGELVVAGNANVSYAHFVEYGTVNMAAHPFLVPSAEANRQRFTADARSALRNL